MGRLKKIVLGLVILYIIWKFLSGLVGGLDLRGGTDLLPGRAWVERIPTTRQDVAHALIIQKLRGERLGIAGKGSAFRWQLDVVEWSLEKDELTIVTKQDDVATRFRVKIRRCSGEAPKPFDLCMDLSSGGKTWHYYSREDWKKLGEPVMSEDEANALFERAARDAEERHTVHEGLPSWLPAE